MASVVKRKRGRPPKRAADLHPNRVAFMVDQGTSDWLNWRAAETGAPVAEIIRRALAAYIAANPKPKT